MNTSQEALRLLEQAAAQTAEANSVIQNLIVEHDYQDVATLVAQAASRLLEAASFLMQSNDEDAFGALEAADDLLDVIYGIIDSELDEDE
jgi:hypothetical protein